MKILKYGIKFTTICGTCKTEFSFTKRNIKRFHGISVIRCPLCKNLISMQELSREEKCERE